MTRWIGPRLVVCALAGVLAAGAGTAAGQQTKDQQKCTNAMNKDLAKIAATASKNIQACVKDYQKGKTANLGPEGTAEGCLTADVKGKLAKAQAKLRQDWDKKCTGTDKNNDPRLPSWGVTDPNVVDDTAVQKELMLVRDVFGSDLDFNLSLDKDPSKCQQGVFKDALKCQDAILKEFTKCKKDGLKGKSGPAFTSGADLAGCLGADPKGKVAKACDDPAKPDKIRKDIDKKCVAKAVDLSEAFPGCDTNDPAQLHDCLQKAVECRACYALKRADGFDATCSSCIPDGPIGTAHCAYDSRAWCVGGPRDGLPCTDGLGNSDCSPGGNCLSNASVFAVTRLSSPNSLFDTPYVGQMDYVVGTPDPGTGVASVQCHTNWVKGIDFGPLIGIVCMKDWAIPGCGSGSVLDCDGGETIDPHYDLYHDIGNCGVGDDPNETDPNNLSGPSQCEAACQAHCAGLGAGWSMFKYGCEGYCRYGARDGLICKNDVDCLVPNPGYPADPHPYDLVNSGECVGGEPVAHSQRCQCECKTYGDDGVPSRPGAFSCEEGLFVDMESNPPCDELDVTMFVLSCSPRTTATIRAKHTDADDMLGATIEAPPQTGRPASCQQLAQDNLGSMHLAGNVGTFDGGLGDQASPLSVLCQGPGYDAGP